MSIEKIDLFSGINWENSKEDNDFMKSFCRQMEVARLKEIYSKRYLLKSGLVTRREYRTIFASTEHADELRKLQDIACLLPQVVGDEY